MVFVFFMFDIFQETAFLFHCKYKENNPFLKGLSNKKSMAFPQPSKSMAHLAATPIERRGDATRKQGINPNLCIDTEISIG